MTDNYYEKLSNERKALQDAGDLPDWFTTAGYQLFKQRYLWAETPRRQYEHIAATLAAHTDDYEKWRIKFFDLLWKGWLSPSTPVLSNTGTNRGLPVSCSGGYVGDSIDGFYTARREAALLTKYGFGTSGYLGDVRSRGEAISAGGKASGIVPVVKGFVQDSRDVSQGGVRRGSWAGYLPLDHPDADELIEYLERETDDLNIGWNITDAFLDKVQSTRMDDEAVGAAKRKFGKALKAKLVTGKGYYWFIDRANRKLPKYYPITCKASNLCSEILLPSDENHTFTCVLSSMNVAKYDEWKYTDAVFTATVFLDCVASEFITRAKGIKGLENAVRFTEKARALGLGVAGFHTYLQSKGWAMDSIDTIYFNQELFEKLSKESLDASMWMAVQWGAPEWVASKCRSETQGKGTTLWVRNCSRLAVAPTKSTALIMGGISEGINPDPAMTFTQSTAGGEVDRMNPIILQIMKERGAYTKKEVQSISDKFGSVQHVTWLNDDEKKVFKTAFEIDQHVLVRLAAQRGKYLDQWQSVNLFFSADEDPAVIRDVHKEAFTNEDIIGLYYVYSKAGIPASKDECEVCM